MAFPRDSGLCDADKRFSNVGVEDFPAPLLSPNGGDCGSNPAQGRGVLGHEAIDFDARGSLPHLPCATRSRAQIRRSLRPVSTPTKPKASVRRAEARTITFFLAESNTRITCCLAGLGVISGGTMTAFDARLRVIGQTGFPLVVEVDLSGKRMTVTAGETRLADWGLEEIKVVALPDGFHIEAEGEEVILNLADKARFAVEVGLRDADRAVYPRLRQVPQSGR